jgi:Putative sensor
VLGLAAAAGGDGVFRDLMLARVIEPVSKLDSLRVLEEAGVAGASYRTVLRRLPAYATEAFRQELSAACAAHAKLGPASLVLYDVSTLYFETDAGDGFREPGFSKERRLEPQITIGLLTGQDGFSLMVSAFEGNKAETKTMLPVIRAFMSAHRLPDVTVVADAGMISEANQKAIEAAGLSFILGMKIPDIPCQVARWYREHPGQDIPDGHVFTQPWPAGPKDKLRDQVIYYSYKADRARRTLRVIYEQVAKAAKAVAGLAPVKRNRFIKLDGTVKSVNRELGMGQVELKMLGVGLAAAILLDATIVRGVLLPAAMTLLGDRCWYLPRWLSRLASGASADPGTTQSRPPALAAGPGRGENWATRGTVAAARGIALVGHTLAGLVLWAVFATAVTLAPLGIGLPAIPVTVRAVRRLETRVRRLSGEWCGAAIGDPYLPEPAGREGRPPSFWARSGSLIADPATWRDLAWITVDTLAGWLLTLTPAGLLAWGAFGLIMPAVWHPIVTAGGSNWYAFIHVTTASTAWLSAALGIAFIAVGLLTAPWFLRRYGALAQSLLAPIQST